MATKQHSNVYVNCNPNMQISFVIAEDMKKYQAQGYRHMMVKFPNPEDIPELTGSEPRILKILMTGKQPKDIASMVNLDESHVRRIIVGIRAKFDCETTTELVLKVQYMGISMFFPQ